jgi:Fe-S-cluster containining protein
MAALGTADPELVAKIERRAQEWIEEHGPTFPGDLDTGILGDSDEDRERFEGFANDAACPALDPLTGRCDVYPYRPMTCRVFGPPVRMGDGNALGHCELCFQGASQAEVEACEMRVPHALEAGLLEEIDDSRETVVAFALLRAGH